jgi:bacillithiol biosynthesis deacetylase BshB1
MNENNLDILAFGAHPDDVEISCGGTLIKSIEEGKRVGIIDLTIGEMGSRGSRETRTHEAARASELLGLTIRENLEFRDCNFQNDEWHRLKIIEKIRQYRPRVVLVNSPSDRHPDHGRASALVREAAYYSGLIKLESQHEGIPQSAFRPQSVFMYIQDYFLNPSFVVDISGYWDKKLAVLKCYSTQFFTADPSHPKTPISGEEFFDFLEGRALNFGRPCGFLHGEGFICDRYPGVTSLDYVI